MLLLAGSCIGKIRFVDDDPPSWGETARRLAEWNDAHSGELSTAAFVEKEKHKFLGTAKSCAEVGPCGGWTARRVAKCVRLRVCKCLPACAPLKCLPARAV
jgi:hypothetical protein